MTISVSVGDSHVGVDSGVDSGVHRVDIVRDTMRAIKLNYEEYLSWGLKKGWESRTDAVLPDRGFVYINDALSAYCLACVFIADDFQIHFISEVRDRAQALGYSYPDEIKAFNDVLGHEMFHNFQNAYNNPGPLGPERGAQRQHGVLGGHGALPGDAALLLRRLLPAGARCTTPTTPTAATATAAARSTRRWPTGRSATPTTPATSGRRGSAPTARPG